jgi:plasmid maintenance system antidote protein VapI
MMTSEQLSPRWVSPPGDTISDILNERALSLTDFAKKASLSHEIANKLLSGEAAISAELAATLAATLGSTSTFWLNREKQFRSELERLFGNPIQADTKNWWDNIPWNELVKLGWIAPLSDSHTKIIQGLRYFNVSSLDTWLEKYANPTHLAAFRTSSTYSSETGAVAAWLRQGEILADEIACKKWNKKDFEKSLDSVRPLTRMKEPSDFLPLLTQICADQGVALVIARSPTGCRASGATRFISKSKAILQLSFRYLSDDHFWFSFFHEAAHLILHGQDRLFLEGTNLTSSHEENEANAFSSSFLIPKDHLHELKAIYNDHKKIMRFAKNLGISPGIVVGQLQHIKLIPHNRYNNLKVRYSWADGKSLAT